MSNVVDLIEVEDLEDAVSQGRTPRPARSYRIRIDKTIHVVSAPSLTGRAILELAGKDTARTKLYEVHNGQKNEIHLDQNVDFTRPGVERFITLPLDQTDGE